MGGSLSWQQRRLPKHLAVRAQWECSRLSQLWSLLRHRYIRPAESPLRWDIRLFICGVWGFSRCRSHRRCFCHGDWGSERRRLSERPLRQRDALAVRVVRALRDAVCSVERLLGRREDRSRQPGRRSHCDDRTWIRCRYVGSRSRRRLRSCRCCRRRRCDFFHGGNLRKMNWSGNLHPPSLGRQTGSGSVRRPGHREVGKLGLYGESGSACTPRCVVAAPVAR